ncbi:MAG: HAMP domain-containing histidine kinase [Bacteroidales bacterium]|nr:HAMP domain-containing histidine kinase [Bacteroidales bacterium]
MEDITERKEAELELHKLNATKDKMFSLISHDLRGPIGSIMNISEILADERMQDDKMFRQFIKSQKELSQNTYYLLENLLNWAKLNRNMIQYNPGTIELASIIDQNIKHINFRAKEKGIEMHTSYSGKYIAFADEDMVKLIVRNLLENAVKFTQLNGFVGIGIEQKDNEMRISITNSGSGISKVNIQKILSDSEYYSTYGTKKEKGTGLGLKIVKEFITLNRGTLTVESKHNKETCFSFTLPLNEKEDIF